MFCSNITKDAREARVFAAVRTGLRVPVGDDLYECLHLLRSGQRGFVDGYFRLCPVGYHQG